MLNLICTPKDDSSDVKKAAGEYQDIWDREGERIVAVMEEISGLHFKRKGVKAIVHKGKSRSHPFHLRSNISYKERQSILIHELCHILLVDNNEVKIPFDSQEQRSLEIHKALNLIFYDMLVSLWGEDFARDTVVSESALDDTYKKAWEWALSFSSQEERKKKFLEFVKNSHDKN